MVVQEILKRTTDFFKEKGIPSARLDAELLIAHALEWQRIQLYTGFDYPLNEAQVEKCRDLVRRRSKGEPVAYIFGHKDFYNHQFAVGPGVLIPRPETEIMVEKTLEWLKQNQIPEPKIIDLGSGSGCIGLSLIAETPTAHLLAIDSSVKAEDYTKQNATKINVGERVSFLNADLQVIKGESLPAAWQGGVDIIVANPPYIRKGDPLVQASVLEFEPSEALFAGEDGLECIRAWGKLAASLMKATGLVMFEIGHDQGPKAQAIFSEIFKGSAVETVKDLAGHDRFVKVVLAV